MKWIFEIFESNDWNVWESSYYSELWLFLKHPRGKLLVISQLNIFDSFGSTEIQLHHVHYLQKAWNHFQIFIEIMSHYVGKLLKFL